MYDSENANKQIQEIKISLNFFIILEEYLWEYLCWFWKLTDIFKIF